MRKRIARTGPARPSNLVGTPNLPAEAAALQKRSVVRASYFAMALLLIAAAGGIAALAQDDLPTFKVDTREVDLYVSVSDKDGKLVSGLPQSAFKVFENNVLQPIKAFNQTDVPVSMGIVIDNSGSMRDKRANVSAASLALVKASKIGRAHV